MHAEDDQLTIESDAVGLAKATSGRLRGIAVVDPAVPADDLRELDRAGVVGIRLNLVGQPLPDLAASEWKGLPANVKAMGWQVEVQRNASDLAALAPQLLDHGVTVVLDHYAPPDAKLGVADPGFQSVLKLGATKNVWVKISARTATVLRARASRKRLIRCFAMPTASIAYCGAATGRTRRQRRVMRRIANFSTR